METFATGDVHDVGVGGSDGDRADRLGRFTIEDRVPCASVVVRLPDAAIHLSHIEDVGLTGNAGRSARASATQRADHAPVQVAVKALGNLPPRLGHGQEYCENRKTKHCAKWFHLVPLRHLTKTT